MADNVKLRLHFLDGLRGLAAFYVVLFHEAVNSEEGSGAFSPAMSFVHALIYKGHYAVVVFIVLPGFSLMLPVARANTGHLVGGLKDFARRRARRILPPYYAAIAVSLASIGSFFVLDPVFHFHRTPIEHVFEVGTIVSHLLLVHNLSFAWAYKINSPMWSVATEWQIYIVFALVLLPVWRRAGNWAVLALAWVLGCLPQILLPLDSNFSWACPWLLGSFALGMLGAVVTFSPTFETSWWRNRAPWGWLGLAAVIVVAVIQNRPEVWICIPTDAAVSVCALCVICVCVSDSRRAPGSSRWLRFFDSRPLVALGAFSYSFYLIQHPLLTVTKNVLNRLHFTRDLNLACEIIVLTPVALAVAWLFSELFERPFTSGGVLLPALRKRFGSSAKLKQASVPLGPSS